ncbi:GBS Bsp-like repeat-containing protein [Hominisplanchenecus sp.]|uniref:GBS Bsp-like repeat-containing protein n=1 Tax=Hominisplanchenecus sp. TaxID=3038130 RepID=UPI00399105E5
MVQKRKLKVTILALMILVMTLMASHHVLAADAGTRDDALKWVYAQEGKFLDYDGAYGAQCVDLIAYYYKYLGQSKYVKGNGCDYVSNALPDGWIRIKNTADFVPEPGDIAVWGTELSAYGHVAIILSADVHSFVSMDQNWPRGSACKRVTHNYNKFWGVIRPNFKSTTTMNNPTIVGTYWGNMTDITFRPVVIINNPETVEKVRFAVWTTGDQSDLKWYDANYNGIGGYFKDIDFVDFANKLYICHVYVYGYNGSVQSVEMERLDNYDYSKPSIRGVYWGNATDTTFRPVVAISNPTSIKSVRFAVWSTSDQRDLKWYDANYNGAGDYFKDIEYSSFVSQHYFCHIYIYGNDGSTQAIALNDFDTYNAEGNFETATGGVGCISIRGWAFDRSNKNESVYIHCYAKDSAGKATLIGITLANLERPDVNNAYSVGNNHGFSEKFITSLSGTYTIEASAMNIGGGKDVTFLGTKTVTITQPTIYFDSCGGNECEPRNVINMEHYGVLPNPSRSGYIFDGWYTEKEDGEKVEEDDIIMLTNDQTLYAHWTKKCEHMNVEVKNSNKPSCTEEGYTGDTYCKDCGTKLSSGKTIAKTEHTWDSGKITKAATCTESGTKTYTCTSCNTTKTEEIPATGNHQNTELRNVKEATCTEEGYTGDTYCKDCGTKLSSGKTIAKTDHTWDAGKITKAATCKESGTKTYTCTSCNTTKTEEIPATRNHQNTELRNVKEATCAQEGYTGDTYCKDCGTKLSSGKTIAKTDHTWDAGKIAKAATCKEPGTKTYTCTSCNTTKTEEIPATGNHQNTELRNVKEATCAQEGYTGDIYCKDCGTKLSSGKTIAKTEHTWDAGKVTKAATCTESGTKTYTCTSCNTTKTEEIPATGNHQNTELRNVKEATCAQEGYTGDTYCKDCGEKLSSGETIAKTDHIWDSGRITKPATDTESGIKTYTCINCNTTRTEEIPATGEHLNTELRGAKSATCLEEGYTGDTYCKDCGTKLSSGTVIPKTGHIWDEGVVTKATTCAEKGIRTYTCSICESTKIEEIPSTGHGIKITKFAKEATYTQEGYTGDIYCQDCGTLLEEGKVLAKLEQPKQTVTPGEMIGDKASNGVYKVLADGRSVEFVRQIVQSKAVKIPDTVSINGTIYAVTGISANAFKNNQLLRTTVIGRNVRRIGKQAFYNCKNLRTITIRTSMLTKKNIGTKAFKGTYKKIKVKVPAKQFKTYKKFFKSKGMSTKAIYKK